MNLFCRDRLRRWMRRFAKVALAVIVFASLAWWFLPRPEIYPDGMAFSRIVRDREGGVLSVTLTPDDRLRLPVELSRVSPDLIAATLAKEDRRFWQHRGVDGRAVARATWGVVSRQSLGGASTLTMQLARLRWKLETRSAWGKLVQMFRAIQLERHYGKEEILEAYLTLAPYGGNVEGIEAAALRWCGKSAAKLTEREAITLAVLPQSPTRRTPHAGRNPYLAQAQARLFESIRGTATPMDAEFVLPIPPLPNIAPHFTRQLLMESDRAEIASTLDGRMQATMESGIARFLSRWEGRGLQNAAAILVHAPTREVRAYVGSADFAREEIDGQVDGVQARRSPGSALKPFIYALALDAGLIHPKTLLDDAPTTFAGYNPENSDRTFLGPIPAAEALRRSRNVPAVELLGQLPDGGLDTFLRRAGVKLTRPPGDYGLSLALGGAEVRLADLARLYAALADDGAARPLITTRHESPAFRSAIPDAYPGLLSAGARWMTLDALRASDSRAPSGLAWKTGTSHGFRDAWACGVSGEWVLCVWIGHFRPTPMQGLFARETAAPLLFELAHGLKLRSRIAPRPDAIVDAEMCADSGMLAAEPCPHRCKGVLLAGVSPIASCDVHREVFVNEAGLQVSAQTEGARRVVREFWPPHRLEQFRRAGLPKAPPPVLATRSGVVESGAPPRLVSPQARLTYMIQPGAGEHAVIPLEARADSQVQQIHWFAGAEYLGVSHPSHPFVWKARPGTWTIQATDDRGRSSSVAIRVAQAAP